MNSGEAQQQQQTSLRTLIAEVGLLIARGYIKHVPGLEDLSEETLKSLLLEYEASKLKHVNEMMCVSLVNGLTTMCRSLKIMLGESLDSMRDELLANEGFVSHTTGIIGKITPLIPYVGMAVGLGIFGKYLYNGFVEASKTMNHTNPEDTT